MKRKKKAVTQGKITEKKRKLDEFESCNRGITMNKKERSQV